MDTFHGLGSVEATPTNPLNSPAFLCQAWQRRSLVRPQLWIWSLAMVPLYIGAFSFAEDTPWFVTLYMLACLWSLYCCHRMLTGAYVRLSVSTTPSARSAVTGYAAVVVGLLVAGGATALVAQPGSTNPGPEMLLLFPLMALFYGGLWFSQFFVGVATVEGHGFVQDLRKAVTLMRGNHLELFLAFLLLSVVMYAMLFAVFLGVVVLFGVGGFVLNLAHCPPLWGTVAAAVLGATVYLGACFEMMAAWLSLHVCGYWELRSRLDPLAEGQGLK